jgi:hypothetical protein
MYWNHVEVSETGEHVLYEGLLGEVLGTKFLLPYKYNASEVLLLHSLSDSIGTKRGIIRNCIRAWPNRQEVYPAVLRT